MNNLMRRPRRINGTNHIKFLTDFISDFNKPIILLVEDDPDNDSYYKDLLIYGAGFAKLIFVHNTKGISCDKHFQN